MYFEQFKVKGLGCYSYLIGCPASGTACVVDPERHVDQYLHAAQNNGLRITHIFETHLHADHISGAGELARRIGADIYVHPLVQAKYPHKTCVEGDKFKFGSAFLEVLETPGHTPNSISLVVTDSARSKEPMMLLTGDLLFVGDLGRPDLAGDDLLEQQIQNLYNSVYKKLADFPDWIEVYPAHGAGSLCGKSLSSKPMSTLGFERKNNILLADMEFQSFRKFMSSEFQERPSDFMEIVRRNQEGPASLKALSAVTKISVDELKSLQSNGAVLVDIRNAAAFGAAFIPGSFNIGLAVNSANWLGLVAETNQDVVLIVDHELEAVDAVRQFRRVGFDRIIGYLDQGISDWANMGNDLDHLPQITPASLKDVLEKYPDHVLIDVRSPQEWHAGHIKGAQHIPINDLIRTGVDLEKNRHVSAICSYGYRANIAGSVLKNRGYRHVFAVIGGMTAWNALDFPVI